MEIVLAKLDKIAHELESKGFVKLATEIDQVTNTLEARVKSRNRPAPIFDSTHPKVTDNKDHFPIPNAAHGRNALARVNQYSSAPSWWKGSLQELKNAVVRAVKGKFPGIELQEEKYKND